MTRERETGERTEKYNKIDTVCLLHEPTNNQPHWYASNWVRSTGKHKALPISAIIGMASKIASCEIHILTFFRVNLRDMTRVQ